MPNISAMKTNLTPQLFLLAIAVFLSTAVFAQSDNSNQFVASLGKEAGSSEIAALKSSYKLEEVNAAHYVSKSGVELILRKGKVVDINLYQKSAVYGAFAGTLPNNLKFGMGSADVKRLLGKPAVSYNSGYSEFEFPAYIVTCWFDGGHLSQVGLTGR